MSAFELIAEARHVANIGPTWRVDILLKQMADALESSSARVTEQEGERDKAREEWAKSVVTTETAISAAKAFQSIHEGHLKKIAELQAQLDRTSKESPKLRAGGEDID